MQIEHIIWDWNGTLLDDIDVSMAALNSVLDHHQLPRVTKKEEYRRLFQFPVMEYYKKVGFVFEKTPFTMLADEYMRYYQPNSTQCKLHVGVKTILRDMKKQGIQQYLLSASNLTFLKQQVANYDIAQYFKGMYGLDNIHAYSKAKLAKDFVLAANLPKQKTVFIGDSVHDSEVAKGAGCLCILIANGHEHVDKLRLTGCPVVDRITQVQALLHR